MITSVPACGCRASASSTAEPLLGDAQTDPPQQGGGRGWVASVIAPTQPPLSGTSQDNVATAAVGPNTEPVRIQKHPPLTAQLA